MGGGNGRFPGHVSGSGAGRQGTGGGMGGTGGRGQFSGIPKTDTHGKLASAPGPGAGDQAEPAPETARVTAAASTMREPTCMAS